jgi:hypothetical protein
MLDRILKPALVAAFGVLACVSAFADVVPPRPPEEGLRMGDATRFYSASMPTYLSVDGRTTISFNELRNIYSVVILPVPELRPMDLPPARGPTLDVDQSCSTPGRPCLNLQGLTMSRPPKIETTVAPTWSAGGAQFRIVSCVRSFKDQCFTHLISVESAGVAQGWYVYSDKRGVELFARKADASGYAEVFMLTADAGVLQLR